MAVIVWLGVPFLVALMCAAVWLRDRRSWIVLFGVGVLLGVAFVLYAYLRAPVDSQHDSHGCSDCGQYIGRWWEPLFVLVLVGGAYLSWLVGLCVGGLLGSKVRRSSQLPAAG